jgi:hypothetical protein
MSRRLQLFFAWPRADRWILAQSLILLPLLALALALLGYKRTQRLLLRFAPPTVEPPTLTEAQMRRIGQLVNLAANRGLYRATCLKRSLALWWILRQRGIDSDLRFGVRRGDNKIDAHAWVEYQGLVLNDRATVNTDYAPFNDNMIELVRGL